MKFTASYPLAGGDAAAEFASGETVAAFARAAEAAGFDAISFTEHPAPSEKWLYAGGHESFDPLSALAFCAAVTERLRLITHLLVLPYRNPLLAAKQIATVDVLSAGRVTVGAGAGYLRSEFAALGVDFDERNELFDEAITAMRGIWSTDGFAFTGRHFVAQGQVGRPRPVQQSGPPIWIGGNSRRARQRAVDLGDGWMPFFAPPTVARSTRTPALSTVDELRAGTADLQSLAQAAGRDPADLDVMVDAVGAAAVFTSGSADEHLTTLTELEAAGVTWVVVGVHGDDVGHALDDLAAYGERVLAARARTV
jgi:probable F420-dependent oxidoreductase